MKILIVDDDPDILEILAALLETFGYRDISQAQSGAQALEIINEAPQAFDLLLLDIQMPRMTGVELCKQIRTLAAYQYSPIIMVTAMSDKAHIDEAFAAGATDYITKPIDFAELKHRVSLAEKASFQAQQLAHNAMAQGQPGGSAGSVATIALSDAIPIDDVIGVLRVHAFENYLHQMNRLQFGSTKIQILTVTNIGSIYERCSSRDFVGVVTDIAECLSDSLREHTPLITYFGRGIFGIAVTGHMQKTAADITAGMYRQVEDAGLVFCDGCPVPITVETFDIEKSTFYSSNSQIDFIDRLLRELKMAAHVETSMAQTL